MDPGETPPTRTDTVARQVLAGLCATVTGNLSVGARLRFRWALIFGLLIAFFLTFAEGNPMSIGVGVPLQSCIYGFALCAAICWNASGERAWWKPPSDDDRLW